MATVLEKIQTIANAKTNIKTAIEAKGVTDIGDKIADYAELINGLGTGGGISVDSEHFLVVIVGYTNIGSYDLSYSTDGINYISIEPVAALSKTRLYILPKGISNICFNNFTSSSEGWSKCCVTMFYHRQMCAENMQSCTIFYKDGWVENSTVDCDISNTEVYSGYGGANETLILYNQLYCLIKGTLITLANGTKKPIEDITFDDDILVWNFYEGKFDTAKPLFIKSVQVASKYNQCTFSNGVKIGFVGEGGEKGYHRIFNADKGSFTYTGNPDTPIGTMTFCEDNTNPTLVSEELIEEPVEFYNIITDKHYNLFANGILTSKHWSNQYNIDTDTMTYNLSKQNISDDTIEKEIKEMKENELIWKTF